MEVPRLEKIVLSQGIGAATADKKLVDYAIDELAASPARKPLLLILKRISPILS